MLKDTDSVAAVPDTFAAVVVPDELAKLLRHPFEALRGSKLVD